MRPFTFVRFDNLHLWHLNDLHVFKLMFPYSCWRRGPMLRSILAQCLLIAMFLIYLLQKETVRHRIKFSYEMDVPVTMLVIHLNPYRFPFGYAIPSVLNFHFQVYNEAWLEPLNILSPLSVLNLFNMSLPIRILILMPLYIPMFLTF